MTHSSAAMQVPLAPPKHLSHIRFPNFFIIGVQKGSSTSLHRYLHQHPDVYMGRRKGAHFFLSEQGELEWFAGQKTEYWKKACRTWDEYASVYERAKDQKVIGDSSIWYQYRTSSAERIRRYRPDAKIVSILRDPVERAFSQFRHHVRVGTEKVFDFVEAMKADEQRIETDRDIAGHYLEQGFYFKQLSKWYENFPADQIRVFLIEDLAKNPIGVLREIFEFLDVDPSFVPDVSERFNVGHIPPDRCPVRSEFLRSLSLKGYSEEEGLESLPNWKKKLVDWNSLPFKLEDSVRAKLIERYKDDIVQLQDFLGRDLSAWLEV